MLRHLFPALLMVIFAVVPSPAATVLVLQFHNASQYPDLNWVGESVAETLMREFSAANEIVLDRTVRLEAIRSLSLHPGAEFTKATLIKLGQAVDTDYLCYGNYEVELSSPDAPLKSSSIRLTAHFLDLRKLHDGPELSEAGHLTDLSRLEEHIAWQSLKYLQPNANFSQDQFMAPQKLIRLDAEESYIRGLMSSNKDQQEKWFAQASDLAPQFAGPVYELGKLALERKDYRLALTEFKRIPRADPDYAEARFDMGIGAYETGGYADALGYFREVVSFYPMNEVYNNLGAAESETNAFAALDDIRRAWDADQNDTTYLFNLGLALLKTNNRADAAKRFKALLARDPDDADARRLLEQTTNVSSATDPLPKMRLKDSFDETAFRELKATLQAAHSK